VDHADSTKLDALERDVCTQWQMFAANGSLSGEVNITTGSGLW
jgi:hypothetical protein